MLPIKGTRRSWLSRTEHFSKGACHAASPRSSRNGASTIARSWRRIGLVPRPSNHSHASPEPTMIKLVAAEHIGDYKIRVDFSDKTGGVLDLQPIVEAGTSMTEPLRDSTFFARFFIEAGALAWPNGLDFSARSLQERLRGAGRLEDHSAAA